MVDTLYSHIDYLNMISTIRVASTPWYVKRTITNDTSKSNMNSILDLIDKNEKDAVENIQRDISGLFREALKKCFIEEFGFEDVAEVSVVYNENYLKLFVFTDEIVIKYSSLEDMVDKVLNYDTNDLFNHRMLRFVYTLYNMSGSEDDIHIEIKRNGTAIFCTNDGLAIKIKHSFYNELKHLIAVSTGKRKESLNRAIAIFNRC